MDEQLEQIIGFLRGQKVAKRSDDLRAWADYLDMVVRPKLAELDSLQFAVWRRAHEAGVKAAKKVSA